MAEHHLLLREPRLLHDGIVRYRQSLLVPSVGSLRLLSLHLQPLKMLELVWGSRDLGQGGVWLS